MHALKRDEVGSFRRIALAHAFDEIASRLRQLIVRDGANSHVVFRGTYNNQESASFHMIPAWMKAIGSTSTFSTITIDQFAKIVALGRMGAWAAGKQEFRDANVWMFAGVNPLVSNWPGFNSVAQNPTLMLKDAKDRGVRLIVIDPRYTETARLADVYLQPIPGQDAALATGMLKIILDEGWHDAAFCDTYLEGLAQLRCAVSGSTAGYVAARCGVPQELLRRACSEFAEGAKRGLVVTGTGPNMTARSNLIEHMYECINVVCGRFLRAGEEAHQQIIARGRTPLHAQVIAPSWPWASGRRSRVRGVGLIGGEMATGVLADEILLAGEGRITSLIVQGGNPAATVPDQKKIVHALQNLELLVTVDPFLSETAKLSHYVIPTTMPYERPDIAAAYPYRSPSRLHSTRPRS
jgi:anaerobic selenocysteine-containing dehydrogenase